MAEALAVAASVIAVIQISGKVGKLCFQYTQDVRGAKDHIFRLQKEVDQIKDVLVEVNKLLTGPNGPALKASQKLKRSLDDCQTQLKDVELRLAVGVQRKELRRFGFRSLKWPFKKEEVDRTLGNLGRCRDTFSLALHVDGMYENWSPQLHRVFR